MIGLERWAEVGLAGLCRFDSKSMSFILCLVGRHRWISREEVM